MELYITELSKYVITLLLALYVLEGFLVFRFNSEEKRKGIYARQSVLLFLVHFSCFMSIVFETENVNYLIFYVLQQLFLFGTSWLYRLVYPKGNRLIINNMCMLIAIGLIMLTRLDMTEAIKQFFIVAVSVAISMLVPFIMRNLHFLQKLTFLYAGIGILAILVVLIMGNLTYGSNLSFSIAGITFQPSEFVKIVFVFYLAAALSKSTEFINIVLTAIIAGIHVLILVFSNDLGSALIFFVTYVLMVFMSTRNFLYLFAGAIGGCGAALFAYERFSHVRVRVQAWKDPWSVIDSAGYQISQSLFGIGSGGLFGLGLFKGDPDAIPFVEKDFIFSAITEEMGLIFAMCVILVCLNSFIMFMNVSMRLDGEFYRLIGVGLGVTYILEVFLTIGGGAKFIPLTGVTLPLISYGGSSMLATVLMFSIIEGLYMVKRDEIRLALKRKQLEEDGYTEDDDDESYEDDEDLYEDEEDEEDDIDEDMDIIDLDD